MKRTGRAQPFLQGAGGAQPPMSNWCVCLSYRVTAAVYCIRLSQLPAHHRHSSVAPRISRLCTARQAGLNIAAAACSTAAVCTLLCNRSQPLCAPLSTCTSLAGALCSGDYSGPSRFTRMALIKEATQSQVGIIQARGHEL